MKSDVRKSTAGNKKGARAEVRQASAVTDVVADADYAAQMFAAADALEPAAHNLGAVSNGPIDAKTPLVEARVIEASETVMTHAKQQDTFVHAIVLPEQCLMRDTIELKSQLLSVLDADASVPIDASKVERIDAAAIQVLLAFVTDRIRDKHHVEWVGMTDVLRDAARILGLHTALHLPAEGEAA